VQTRSLAQWASVRHESIIIVMRIFYIVFGSYLSFQASQIIRCHDDDFPSSVLSTRVYVGEVRLGKTCARDINSPHIFFPHLRRNLQFSTK
jgi:hypothetical protein